MKFQFRKKVNPQGVFLRIDFLDHFLLGKTSNATTAKKDLTATDFPIRYTLS